MYTIGLWPAVSAFLSSGWAAQVTVSVIILVVILSLCSTLLRTESPETPPRLPVSSLLSIAPFFHKRFDFLDWGFRLTGQPAFQFNLLWNTVVAVSGDEGRRLVYTNRDLDLHEGFKVLSGAIPILAGVTSDLQAKSVALIHRRLGGVQSRERLTDLIPKVTEDTRRIMETWGLSGAFDPWDKIHELVFQTTVRALSCEEIADDAAVVERLKHLYDTLDRGNTPMAVLLPAFPSPSMLRNTWATKKIYDIIMASIHARQASGIARGDTLQMMLDLNTEPAVIAGFMMGLIVAGSRSTGTTASWLLTFLGSHPAWRARVAAELGQLLTPHAPAEAPLSTRVAAVPLDAWERDTPALDAAIAETLRLAQPHVAMRRNLGPDVQVGAYVVPTGAYVVYPFADAHLDPALYPDPLAFDPSRRSSPKAATAYVGWGAGKNICAGQRLARLELKILTAMFVLGFEYAVVDMHGKPTVPRPDWNDTLTCRPLRGTSRIQYNRTNAPL